MSDELKNYLIFFADLIGSTEVASEASPYSFARYYLLSYHWAVDRAFEYLKNSGKIFGKNQFKKLINQPRNTGDEIITFTAIENNEEDFQDLVASSITYGFVLKMCWFTSPYNLLRLLHKKFPRDVAIGIHIGPAVTIRDGVDDSDIAGLHINVSKRLETAARSGKQSLIYVSDDIKYQYEKWQEKIRHTKNDDKSKTIPLEYTRLYDIPNPVDMKGIPIKITPSELQLDKNARNDLDELFKLMKKTPSIAGTTTENALSMLGKYLTTGIEEWQFSNDHGQTIGGKELAQKWFEANENSPNIFYNDLWTVVVFYFISCAYLLNFPEEPLFNIGTNKIYNSLKKLIQEKNKNGGRD